ncbi:N-acetyltransferase [Vagococcus sp. PNs007]|uniref:N-acetyltransferase n=1 Tax=Vagococcus proximus TaxID=2991417 RepID=A0ABT5X1S8_9ENTE|nr:N-acetyltransferase [Vagococcus proximus]MDF0479947.1 N-acetyltransferase [Vagococcus proximus]
MPRTIRPKDFDGAKSVIHNAFLETDPEANEDVLVEALREEPTYDEEFELVIEKDGEIIAHGMLSDIAIGEEKGFLALAPLAVKKSERCQGYGASIIAELEKRAIMMGYRAVSILGDPAYYSRFGYTKAADFGVESPLEVPKEYYMIKELVPGALADTSGVVTYVGSFGIES